MNERRLYQVVIGPHVTEKGVRLADQHNQVTMRVARDADKSEIKQAVEKLFNVTVKGVQVLNTKSRAKRFGQRVGYRSGWKKAFVTLQEGHDINWASFE